MKKKIFFPLDPNWGLVMQRITLDIQRFAPPEFEFVDSHEKADIVFWHVIGPRKIPNDKPYVMLFIALAGIEERLPLILCGIRLLKML